MCVVRIATGVESLAFVVSVEGQMRNTGACRNKQGESKELLFQKLLCTDQELLQ